MQAQTIVPWFTLFEPEKFVPDSPELLLDFGVQAESMRIYSDATPR